MGREAEHKLKHSLRPHQSEALKRLKNGSILWGAVGVGKSRVAVEYYLLEECPRDVYVITTAKKRDSLDWMWEFSNFGIGTQADETVAGILCVDSWNNIAKYKDVEGAFFIFDEQRLVGKGKWVKAFLRIARRNRWILLSATPGDTWLDYIPVFIANGFYTSRQDFELQHVMWTPYIKYPKVSRYVGVNRLVKQRNDILVRMRFEKETIRHTQTIWVDYDQELWDIVTKERWNPWRDRPIKDAAELFSAMRRVANGHDSRVRAVEALLSRHSALIVFYSFNYELEALRALNEKYFVAEWNGHKHEEIPDQEAWVYLVQYTAGSEGWNCTSTNAMAFYSLTSSYKKWEQAHGRIDRLNTSFIDLYYYIFRSKTLIDTSMWRSMKAKKDFNYRDVDLKMLDWN
jgi:hypothetical protein